MFFRITNAVKKILILELQKQFDEHPLFGNGDLKIVNKFSFEERPKYAIVLKSANADSNKLALDNFKGEIISYVTLANLKGVKGRMIEWVREDTANVENLVPPGYYVVTMDSNTTFTVEPFLNVDDEILEPINMGFFRSTLAHKNVNEGSEIILTEDGVRLVKNRHYTIDNGRGEITFLVPIAEFGEMKVDYQYRGNKTGPFPVETESANSIAIPGVVLAFGTFLEKDGVQVVVVYPDRQLVAQSYIGKWKLNIEFSVVAQDTDTQEQIVDLLAMFLWGNLQDVLVNDGIYIDSFNISGESEEDEQEVAGEKSFLGGLSLEAQVEWEIFKPVLGIVKGVFLSRIEDKNQYDPDEMAARKDRSFNPSQRGVDYSVGMQVVENVSPYVVRPVQPYSLYTPDRTV